MRLRAWLFTISRPQASRSSPRRDARHSAGEPLPLWRVVVSGRGGPLPYPSPSPAPSPATIPISGRLHSAPCASCYSYRMDRWMLEQHLAQAERHVAGSDDCGHLFRLKADRIPIDCGQRSDDGGQLCPSTFSWGHAAEVASSPDCLAANFRMLSPFRIRRWAL
jgi:hypothetical protein